MKKAVLIISESNFRDEELFVPKGILEEGGVGVKIASTTLSEAKGMLGGVAKPDILISDIKVDELDALVFVGGSGSQQYWDDPLAHKLAQDALKADKVVAAICIAPVTLARAGLLKGKRATVFSSEAKELRDRGANYTGRPVEKDGKIITASGPSAAADFATQILITTGCKSNRVPHPNIESEGAQD